MALRYLKSSFPFWFGLVWAVVGTIPLGLAVWQTGKVTRNRTDHYEKQATVTDTNSRPWRNGGRTYYVDVGYLDRSGRPRQTSIEVPRKEWEAARPGQTRTVYVSGSDPSEAWFEHQSPSFKVPAILGFLSLFFFPPGVIAAGVGIRGARRRANAIRNGQVHTGRVTSVREDPRVKVNGKLTRGLVEWTWVGSDGKTYAATSLSVPLKLAFRYEEGQEVEVFADPAHPAVGEIDLFGLRSGSAATSFGRV